MRVCSEGRRRSIGWSQRLVSGALFQGQTGIPRDYGKRRAASVCVMEGVLRAGIKWASHSAVIMGAAQL